MRDRTVILVSHHVQLCVPGVNYVVALENGRVQFQGDREAFQQSEVLKSLSQTNAADQSDEKEDAAVVTIEEADEKIPENGQGSEASSTVAPTTGTTDAKPEQRKVPRRLVEEEKRAVGRISQDIWSTYIKACGGWGFWSVFALSAGLAALAPVADNGWLK